MESLFTFCQPETEMKFLLDMDLSMGGNVPCTMAAGALEALHIHGGRIFEGAVTDRLRQAMEPRRIAFGVEEGQDLVIIHRRRFLN